MNVGYVILIIIILILLFVIGALLNVIEEETRDRERYFRNLRRTYEIYLEELKKDIEIRDELLNAYTHNKFRR